jgi:hypothetical protein
VLFGDLVDGGKVNITIVNNDLNFEVSPILSKEQKKALKRAALPTPTSIENVENQTQ